MGEAKGKPINKAFVEAMKPRAKTFRVPDEQTRGLYIQMTPAGVLSWVLRFRVHGREKTHSIGRWPEVTVAKARAKAIILLGDINDGNDPAAKKKAERAAKTVKELAEQFRTEHLPTLKRSTAREYGRLLDARIIPALGSMRVKDVDAPEVARLLAQIRKETPKGIMANRTRAVLSKMFTLGSLWGFCAAGMNPTRGQARAPETKKDRHLSDRELIALGTALRHLEPTPEGQKRDEEALDPVDVHALAAFRLYLLTGMRKSELIGEKKKDKETGKYIVESPALPWRAVDLDAGQIRLESHKTSKKAGTRTVHLCTAACKLMESLPKVLGNPYVIPGYEPGEALVGLPKMWTKVQEAVDTLQATAKVAKKERVDLSDVTIHDLRRSFASLGARLGYPTSFTGALLGHAAGSVTEGYARLGTDPLRDAVEVIGTRMADLLAGKVDLAKEAKEAKAAKEEAAAKQASKGARVFDEVNAGGV